MNLNLDLNYNFCVGSYSFFDLILIWVEVHQWLRVKANVKNLVLPKYSNEITLEVVVVINLDKKVVIDQVLILGNVKLILHQNNK